MNLLKRLAVIAAAGLLLAGVASAQTLRFTDYSPNRGSRATALQWFADELKARSGGRLAIEFHWGGSLLGGKATLKGLADGVADMGTVIGFFTPQELKAYNIGDLPVDNADAWVGLRAMHDIATTHPAMQKEFEKAGVAYVTNYTTGPIQLICRQPVSTLADLKGKKVRGSGPYAKAMSDLGAIAQRMSQADVYQALDSGLIDCNQNYYYAMKAYKQYEVAPHVLALDWGQNMSFGVFMSRLAWERLDASDQALVRQLGSDFIDHLAQIMIEESAADRAQMEAGIGGKQITVRQLPDAQRMQLQQAGGKHIDTWVAEATASDLDGAGLLAAYRARIGHWAAERQAKGYPWTR
jgi:TRAP-type C4-dicarboxylate transport system substrate-binding protein